MKHKKMIVNTVVALELAALLWIGIIEYYGSISDFRQYICWKMERIPSIGLIDRDMTRNEMLLRFGQADFMKIYYDKKHGEVTEFYYCIDEDDKIFLMFTSSWQTDKIIEFNLVRGYRTWQFLSYRF